MNLQSVAAEVLACLSDDGDSPSLSQLAERTGASAGDVAAACALLADWRVLAGAGLDGIATHPQRAQPSGRLVLVIENTPAVSHVLNALLDSEGYQVLLTDTLSGGMAVLRRVLPALVVADSFSSSSTDAISRLQPLRELAAPAPVLLFTAHRDITEEAARAAGFAGVLPKPFDIDDLLARVAEVADATLPAV
jgi:CheY-like chemotaxis protein